MLTVIVAIAILAPILPLAPPNETAPANRLLPPLSPGHLLGTDELGRDLLSRIVWGTRLSLFMGVAATLVAALVGSTIGILAGYFGGRLDNALMRSIDMLMAFPYILLALAIVAVLGPGLLNALYAVAIVNIPFFARNIRGVTVGIAHKDYIVAARLSGMGNARILASEVLAQRHAGDRDHHVDHGGLDDPGDRRALLPRARLAAPRRRISARSWARGAR